jgi:hypothetical protein
LESDSANSAPVPASNTVTKPRNHIRIAAVVAAAVIVTVVGALLVSSMISKPQGQDAWLFKGAYAKYEGSTSMSYGTFDFTFDFTVREEVLDFNSTHVKISTYFKMNQSYGGAVENETAAWVPLSQMGFMNAFEEGNLTKSYESTVNIAGLGTRTCMIYEYAISDNGLTMTVYVDKQIDWPLKMTVSLTGSYPMSLDINLTETNIPGLK